MRKLHRSRAVSPSMRPGRGMSSAPGRSPRHAGPGLDPAGAVPRPCFAPDGAAERAGCRRKSRRGPPCA